MHRRYAILPDNQRVLEERLDSLRAALPPLVAGRVCAVMVVGSVAEGRARDASDIDLVVVLRDGSPRRADYAWWDTEIASRLPGATDARFPLQPIFIGRDALSTTEPNLRRALDTGLHLWDPAGILDDQPEACT